MYCEKCGSKLNEMQRCPNCYIEKPSNVIFVFAIISVVSTMLAFNLYLMIIGMLISLIVFVWGIVLYKKDNAYPRIGLSITLSVIGFVCNLIWYLFATYLL